MITGLSCGLVYADDAANKQAQAIAESDLVIQEMQRQDLGAVTALFERNSDISLHTSIDSDFSKYLGKNRYTVYLCKHATKDEIYGFVVAIQKETSLYIRALGVDKDCRRFGIATKLLKQVYDLAKNKISLYLTIIASNENARKCYEKFGFKDNPSTGCLTISFADCHVSK